MKIILYTIILSLLFIPLQKAKPDESNGKSKFAKNHIIVKMKDKKIIAASSMNQNNSYKQIIEDICNESGLSYTKTKILFPFDTKNNTMNYFKHELGTFFLVFFKDGVDIKDACNKFENDNKVEFAEPDFIGEGAGKKGTSPNLSMKLSLKPNDEYFYRQWGLSNDGVTNTTRGASGKSGADMNVLSGWDIETGSEEIIVAILDSGVKTDHPDLTSRFWINKDETRNGRDDDGNGFVDDINGYNFAYDNPNIKDDGGHGTNIAGTIGASTNNNLGYAGIDQRCRLMICKNLDEENLGEYSWWSASLYYAANNKARVINMSEGGYDYSKTLQTAINYAYDAGCFIVASMMNKNNSDVYYPASFSNVFAIGATDTDDSRCRQFTWGGGSNWGKHIAVVAPGNRIYGLDYKDNNNFEVYWSGTSQATAYVSGIASLLLAQDKSRTNAELKKIITTTAKDQVGDSREDSFGWDEYYGYGRVDLFAALNSDNKYEKKEYRNEKKKDEDNDEMRAKSNKSEPKEDDDNKAKGKRPH